MKNTEIRQIAEGLSGKQLSRARNQQAELKRLAKLTGRSAEELSQAKNASELMSMVTGNHMGTVVAPAITTDDLPVIGWDEVVDALSGNEQPAEEPAATEEPMVPKRKGRRSKWAGHTIKSLMNTNPRKPNTHGSRAFQFILESGGQVTHEEFRAAGHTDNHLRWDLAHGHITIQPTD